MSRAKTLKPINPSQFAAALGVTSLRFLGPAPESAAEKTVEVDGVTQADLDAALAAYTYDPDWTPDPEQTEKRRARTRAKELAAKAWGPLTLAERDELVLCLAKVL